MAHILFEYLQGYNQLRRIRVLLFECGEITLLSNQILLQSQNLLRHQYHDRHNENNTPPQKRMGEGRYNSLKVLGSSSQLIN